MSFAVSSVLKTYFGNSVHGSYTFVGIISPHIVLRVGIEHKNNIFSHFDGQIFNYLEFTKMNFLFTHSSTMG